jgi:hypothetical protein
MVKWDDILVAHQSASKALEFASRPPVLGALLKGVLDSDALSAQCERFNLFSKIVLIDGRSEGWKLRLHMFGQEVLEAHHHRAPFCARVLAGEYQHLLFGANSTLENERLSFPLRPLFVQTQAVGSAYIIDSEMVHATLASENTVSLMLQGPVDRHSFDIYELRTGVRRTRVGAAASDRAQEAGEERIDAAHLSKLIQTLHHASLAS